ncbi:MAG: hypothetical protein QM604_00470 [Microbacterium sp.]
MRSDVTAVFTLSDTVLATTSASPPGPGLTFLAVVIGLPLLVAAVALLLIRRMR